MPIKISTDLPAYKTLLDENIFVMPDNIAEHQDIRALRIAILNLMPKKIETETQFLRLLSNTPLQVDVDFVHVESHVSKNTSVDFFEIKLDGSRLLLCTDGLHGCCSDDEILAAANDSEVEEAARKLVDMALEKGGPDNITLAVVENS